MENREFLTVPGFIADIAERLEHCDTMQAPSPLELQWFRDFESGFADRYAIEADKVAEGAA